MPIKHKAFLDTGGMNQRLTKAKVAATDPHCNWVKTKAIDRVRPLIDSASVFSWLQKWSWGKMSSIEVQKEAHNSHNDYQRVLGKFPLNEDHMPTSIQQLAQLGQWGTHTGNVNRELKHWLGEPTVPKAKLVTVPLVVQKPAWDAGEAFTKEVEFPILLPHEMISHVYNTYPSLFSELYIGEHSEHATWGMKLEEFWATVADRSDPRLVGHPMRDSVHWQREYVPLSIHGDAVPVTKIGKAGSKSMDVYSTSGLLGVGTTKAMKLYTFGLFTTSEVKDNRATMAKIWKTVMWSLHWAYLCLFPTQDEDGNALTGEQAGKPLAGGFKFVLWSIKADLDHWAKAYGLSHYNCIDPCEFCPANRQQGADPKSWINYFGPDATWKRESFTPAYWRQMQGQLHFLFDFLYLSQLNLEPDELHVMHLGTSQYMLGAVLYLLCFKVMLGSPEENLHEAWAEISQYYSDHSVETQYSALTICSFFEPGQYPKLKGKGAEVKDLVAPLAKVWLGHTTGSNVNEYTQISAMLNYQCDAQRILHDHKDMAFLPKQRAIEFAYAIDGVLHMWSLVARAAFDQGEIVWNMTTKLHYLYHLGQKAWFLNPRRGNCMVEETYMGVCKTLAKSCLNSTTDHNMPKMFMEKYYWALHFNYLYGDKFHPI